jgi:enoyl reductase-like protein
MLCRVSKESDWSRSYEGEIGGVITVVSELGEPIHKLATRGICGEFVYLT